MEKKVTERPVIVCTEHRGVFFGYDGDTTGTTIMLERARMAIYFGTTGEAREWFDGCGCGCGDGDGDGSD